MFAERRTPGENVRWRTGLTRSRDALRRLGTGTAAALLGSILPTDALAAPPKCPEERICRGRCCPEGHQCCQSPRGRIACKPITESQDGRCGCATTCPSPEDECCNGRCTNVVFDRRNCGSCGNTCGPREECCPGRGCVRLRTRTDCSFCGDTCRPGESCMGRLGCCTAERVCGDTCCSPGQPCLDGHCVI
jgi:hypothetical protein